MTAGTSFDVNITHPSVPSYKDGSERFVYRVIYQPEGGASPDDSEVRDVARFTGRHLIGMGWRNWGATFKFDFDEPGPYFCCLDWESSLYDYINNPMHFTLRISGPNVSHYPIPIPVPEPGMLVGFALGLGLLGWRRARVKKVI
jgi:hypothetical protein